MKELEENFDARHGMWEDWEDWQRDLFWKTEALQFNKMNGYGRGAPDSEYVWTRPFPGELS